MPETSQRTLGTRSAFTLIEVMIAMAIIAGGLASMLGLISTQQQGRDAVRQTQTALSVLGGIQERMMSEPWSQLAKPAVARTAWTRPTMLTPSTPFSTGYGESVLLEHGLITRPSGLRDLRLHIQYFRAVTAEGGIGAKGIFDLQSDTNDDDVADGFTSPLQARTAMQANVATAQRFDTDPTSQVGTNEPLAIRVTLIWRGTGDRMLGAVPLPGGPSDARMLSVWLCRGEG
jgi:prepilin-type N-terminal cleavage/methylation domain-containing protein